MPYMPLDFDSLDGETRPTRWQKISNYYNESPKLQYGVKGLNLLAYAIPVSVLFAMFAYRRATIPGTTPPQIDGSLGVWYATCSFVMNIPMAYLFAGKAVTAFARLKQKGNYAYKIAFGIGFLLALGTSVAGIAIARESVGKQSLNSFVEWYLTSAFVFNTFTTRLVGSAYLLSDLYEWAHSKYLRGKKKENQAYFEFRDDVDRYGKQVGFELTAEGETKQRLLESYARKFYSKLKDKGLHPGTPWYHEALNYTVIACSAVIMATLILNMMPLWIKLTVNGALVLDKDISQTSGLASAVILFSSLSNELFYAKSAWYFIPTLRSAGGSITTGLKEKLESKHVAIKLAAVSATLVGIGAWATTAYFSGGGFGEDALTAMSEGFGTMANRLWFSWFAGDYTNLFLPGYDTVAAVASGTIVNGLSFVNFAMNDGLAFCSWFMTSVWPRAACCSSTPEAQTSEAETFGHKEALAALDECISKNDFESLSGIHNGIEIKRLAGGPHRSVLSFFSSCYKSSSAPETASLVNNNYYGSSMV